MTQPETQACGDDHSIVVTIANEVYGFGSGVHDQLGVGTLGLFPKPQRIPGLTAVPRIQAVSLGGLRMCVHVYVLRERNVCNPLLSKSLYFLGLLTCKPLIAGFLWSQRDGRDRWR